MPFMKNFLVDLNLNVSDLLDPVARSWGYTSWRSYSTMKMFSVLLKWNQWWRMRTIELGSINKHGCYSVKFRYWLNGHTSVSEIKQWAEAQPSLDSPKESVWKVEPSMKIKNFLWRTLNNAIPAGELILHRGVKLDPCCQLCGFPGKSPNHILFSCSVAIQVWTLSNILVPEDGFCQSSLFSNYHYLISLAKKDVCRKRQSENSHGSCGFFGKTVIFLSLMVNNSCQ